MLVKEINIMSFRGLTDYSSYIIMQEQLGDGKGEYELTIK